MILKKLKAVVIGLCILFFLLPACGVEEREIDYRLKQVELGLSFVPDSKKLHRQDTLKHMTYLGVDKIRMAQSWHLRQPDINTYHWQPLKERLDFYENNNIDVLMTLDIKTFPDWTHQLGEDEILTYYEAYVGTLLDLYGKQINSIQVGNEWNWEIEDYLAGNVGIFIQMNNILYDAVEAMEGQSKPNVVLGSISIGGLRALAFEQELMDNVYFKEGPLYSEEDIAKYQEEIQATNVLARRLLSECKFDLVDLHFYDDYWNWSIYIEAFENELMEVGLIQNSGDMPIIASEFGGPDPKMEPEDDTYRARQLAYYITTLDGLGVKEAYYFKLHEAVDKDTVYHPYSFLIERDGSKTETYEVLSQFKVD